MRLANMAFDLPQLGVVAEQLDGGPDISAAGGLFGYRKRMGGVNGLWVRGWSTLYPTASACFRTIFRRCASTGRNCDFALVGDFTDAWQTPRSWNFDAPSPLRACGCSTPLRTAP